MTSIEHLLRALDERTVAQQVGIRHDEARVSYHLTRNTVADWDDFIHLVGDYFNHHMDVAYGGGVLPRDEAESRAKQIIERSFRRGEGNAVSAFNDAHDGTNGGLRGILDRMASVIQQEAIENYIRAVFDRYVKPNSWDDQVEIIRQFVNRCGIDLSSSIDTARPERYARNYLELIRSYADGVQRTSSALRRL